MTDIDRQVYAMDSRYRYKYTDGDGTVIYFIRMMTGYIEMSWVKGLKVELISTIVCMSLIKNQFECFVLSKWKFI